MKFDCYFANELTHYYYPTMKLLSMKNILTLVVFLLASGFLSAQQDSSRFAKKLAQYKIKASIGVQMWAVYSMGFEEQNFLRFTPVDDRLDMQFRRSRFSLKGEPYDGLKFNFTAALDFIGRDLYSSTEAGSNNGASPRFRIWNAFVQWRLFPKSDGFHLSAGYMVPNIGRESITGALAVSSFEKAWSQNYLRRHLVGTGPGRTTGINLGGMLANPGNYTRVSYDVGFFRPVQDLVIPNTEFSPLVTGRIAIHVNEPEFDSYQTGHKVNYFGKRNGMTIAVAAAKRFGNELSPDRIVYGGDFLFNKGQFNFDGELHFLRSVDEDLSNRSNTGYLRASYNFPNAKKGVFEPALMYWWFNGALERTEIAAAQSLGTFYGSDSAIDIGFNYYFNPKLKLSLHYTFRDGKADNLNSERASANNNFFTQPGLTQAIRRGDYLGLGLVSVF